MVQHVLERVVVLGQRADGFVEHVGVRLGGIAELALEVRPAGAFRHEKGVVKVRVLAVLYFRLILDHSLLDLAADDPFTFGVEDVRATLEEQHPKDVVLVGGRIEALLTEAIRRGVEVALEFGE